MGATDEIRRACPTRSLQHRRVSYSGKATRPAVRDGADTVVTSEQNVDTAIVTQDTTVDVDTTKKEGDEPVSRDTLSETGSPSAEGVPSDSAQ